MKYYYVAIEQAYVTESGQTVLKEYMTKKEYNDYQSADTGYFTRCAELANAIGKTHEWAMIKMCNSKFGVYDGHSAEFGEYKENVEA